MIPVLEAVPNFSIGPDPAFVEQARDRVEAAGAEVLDHSSDADHGRTVLTVVGAPARVENAAVALAHLAVERIDLRKHGGAHPRVGALDVLPLVPLAGLSLEDARDSAHRVGNRIAAEVGVPVWFYAEASEPRGRSLAELRRGGFEALVGGVPPGRRPDLLPDGGSPDRVHPTAGGACVGARPLLLAWNLDVVGVSGETLRRLAAELRESGGGIQGLRVLALELPGQRRSQLSMNLENARSRKPFAVFEEIERRVKSEGGRVTRTEVIGLAPDELLEGAAADRLRTLDRTPPPALSSLLALHLSRRASEAATALMEAVRCCPEPVPATLVAALEAMERELLNPPKREPVE
ncbi:MAG: glutamate formiminotransferase [Gemmatimonadales bacterium]|nr:MAG: glutamate formiminotransferase [Gemmatimonadales bacterium]